MRRERDPGSPHERYMSRSFIKRSTVDGPILSKKSLSGCLDGPSAEKLAMQDHDMYIFEAIVVHRDNSCPLYILYADCVLCIYYHNHVHCVLCICYIQIITSI